MVVSVALALNAGPERGVLAGWDAYTTLPMITRVIPIATIDQNNGLLFLRGGCSGGCCGSLYMVVLFLCYLPYLREFRIMVGFPIYNFPSGSTSILTSIMANSFITL